MSEWKEIPTSIVGKYNDLISLYVKELSNGLIMISDDGETVGDVFLDFTEEEKNRVNDIASRYGIVCQEFGELTKVISQSAQKIVFRDFESAIKEILKINRLTL